MKQGWKPLSLGVALAVGVLAMLPLVAPQTGDAEAARRTAATTSAAKSKNNLRQFTGIVTALDKTTMTVEKRGKKPQSRVFTRHAELKTTGDLEKDAHVTVYYRDEGGQAVARRVVVKPEGESPSGDR
ncbi:MAG: hypothetical protein AAB113_06545 [Candidatus Eisenbacteria bacterium]